MDLKITIQLTCEIDNKEIMNMVSNIIISKETESSLITNTMKVTRILIDKRNIIKNSFY